MKRDGKDARDGGGKQPTQGLACSAHTPPSSRIRAQSPSALAPETWWGCLCHSQGPGLTNQNIPSRSAGSRGKEEVDQANEMQPQRSCYSS